LYAAEVFSRSALPPSYWNHNAISFETIPLYFLWLIGQELAPGGFYLLMGYCLGLTVDRKKHDGISSPKITKHLIYSSLWILPWAISSFCWLIPTGKTDPAPLIEKPFFFYWVIFFSLATSRIITALVRKFPVWKLFMITAFLLIISSTVHLYPGVFTQFHPWWSHILYLPGGSNYVLGHFTLIPWVGFAIAGLGFYKLIHHKTYRPTEKMLFLFSLLVLFFLFKSLDILLDPKQTFSLESYGWVCKFPPGIPFFILSVLFSSIYYMIFSWLLSFSEKFLSFFEIVGNHSISCYAITIAFVQLTDYGIFKRFINPLSISLSLIVMIAFYALLALFFVSRDRAKK